MVASAYINGDMSYDAAVSDRVDENPQLNAQLDCCTVSASNHAELSISKRLITHQCASLVPYIRSNNEKSDGWTLKTTADYETLKDILHFLQYGSIETDDWLRLETILEQVFEYLLYNINDAVSSKTNTEFLRLDVTNLCEILNSDMLNITEEMDIWKLIKNWILVDRKTRTIHWQTLFRCLRWNLLNEDEKRELNEELVQMKFITSPSSPVDYNRTYQTRVARDLILAVCGWEWSGPSSRIEVLDIAQRKWKRVPSMEDQRKASYHAIVVIDQKLYLLGGSDGSDCFNTVRCYDGEKREWSELAPMHYARYVSLVVFSELIQEICFRCYIAACELNGKIIAVGGSDGYTRLRSAEMYDPEKNQWTLIAEMNEKRSDAAAASMAGRVYVAGGYTGTTILQSVEMYIPEKDVWIEIAVMNTPRSGHACLATENYLLLAGGYDGTVRLDSVEMLRLGSGHTFQMPSMPCARSNFDMCKLGSKIYAIGGYCTIPSSEVLCFDGTKWEFSHELGTGRSALKVVLLRGWPNPTRILNDEEETMINFAQNFGRLAI
ncbi:unnamed protein product [Anisakis simplex]|uniref:Spermatocyte protein spe-26 (inferred by orthology to a C. elegans protein) n=1 Tax=Anisakis simplex TaxID=6269 RepID=A0A0M3JW63_ANISI|nr:unnamed protein product [Anisakis simplex]